MYDSQRLALKVIELMRVKQPETVNRVTKSSSVQMLTFGMEYDEVIQVLPRAQTIAGGGAQIPVCTGYDFEKAFNAGNTVDAKPGKGGKPKAEGKGKGKGK